MATSNQLDIAIVGAGLAGLGMAIAAQRSGLKCRVYEAVPASGRASGAVMLSPNALKILDAYGIYEQLKTKGFEFETGQMYNEKNEPFGTYWMGSEKLFGYKALRIYRSDLVKSLVDAAHAANIEIIFNKKFRSIVEENENEVKFQFEDGTVETASLLVGADGIHSRLREYISPGAAPVYAGSLAVAGAVKRSKVKMPITNRIESTEMFYGTHGACVLAPQRPNAEEFMIGVQRPHPELDREGWTALAADTEKLLQMLRENISDWPPFVQSALEEAEPLSLYIWALHAVPRLENWTSHLNRVIIIGDAAHAIPPTAGQGANQALEDGYTLTLLLQPSKSSTRNQLGTVLRHWQDVRQERIDKVMALTKSLNNLRLPVSERAKLPASEIWHDADAGKGDGSRMAWLFKPDFEAIVSSYQAKMQTIEA